MNSLTPWQMAYASSDALSQPGQMMHLSAKFTPPILKGVRIYPNDPFNLDFILDQGETTLSAEEVENTSKTLVRYFLASLTIPEKDLWVNLSPYEKERIAPEAFGVTEMGRDLLSEDYLLKQLTASLLYPEDEIGQRFWKRIAELTQQKFGNAEIPTSTFNKVWIVPEKAVVYENTQEGVAYIVESKLKVMLEEDYEGTARPRPPAAGRPDGLGTPSNIASSVVREIIIPELTKEINENKNFAKLRQIYQSYILATWYKQKIKNSILSHVYVDKNKTAGVNIENVNEKQQIYEQYLEAFKKGVYNYIKEDYDPVSQEMIPRKYFSGGVQLAWNDSAVHIIDRIDPTVIASSSIVGRLLDVQISAGIAPAVWNRFDSNVFGSHDVTPRSIVAFKEITPSKPSNPPQMSAEVIEALDKMFGEYPAKHDPSILYSLTSDISTIDGKRMSGVVISYKQGGATGPEIGRFKFHHDGDTMYFSGLLSRDNSDPSKEVPMIANYINFDYSLAESLDGFTNFGAILRKKLGDKNYQALLKINLGNQRYSAILRELYAEDISVRVNKVAFITGRNFNDVLNEEFGGQDYSSIPVVLKVLARAGVGLNIGQIQSAEFADPSDLLDVLAGLREPDRTLTPSQRFPPNTAISIFILSLFKPVEKLAKDHGYAKFKLQIAVPDGFANLRLYLKTMGIPPESLVVPPGDEVIIKMWDEFSEEVKKNIKNASAKSSAKAMWAILEKYKFQHKLLTITKDIDRDIDLDTPAVRQEIERIFDPYIPELERMLGQQITMEMRPNTKTNGLTEMPGLEISLVTPDGFKAGHVSLNSQNGSLWISELKLQAPETQETENDRVVVIPDDLDYNYKPGDSRAALNHLAAILSSKIGPARLEALLNEDMGQEKYTAVLHDLFGEIYDETLKDFAVVQELETTQESRRGELLPKRTTFVDLMNDMHNGGVGQADINLPLKALAVAAAGLTKGQLDALEIDRDIALPRLISLLDAQVKPYFPTQRYPSSAAFGNILNGIAKELPEFAKQAGFSRVKVQVVFPEAISNFILYSQLGYSLDTTFDVPLVRASIEKFLQDRAEIKDMTQLSWQIAKAFRGTNRVVPMTRNLKQAAPNNRGLLMKLKKAAESTLPNSTVFVQPPASQTDIVAVSASTPVGGIDFNPQQMDLVTQNSNGEIEFNIDPFLLEQMQNVPGFTPTIRGVQPIKSLQTFLGAVPSIN